MMQLFADYHDFVGANLGRFFKATIFQTPRMLVGTDCLEPGQTQHIHQHAGRDKLYLVMEGQGEFTVGAETRACDPGELVFAPADQPHGVVNTGNERLVMVIVMAPEPG
jgi:quercetin dioxygenase-like cupin family protein